MPTRLRPAQAAVDAASFTTRFATVPDAPPPLLTNPVLAPRRSLEQAPAVVVLRPEHPARGLLLPADVARGMLEWLEDQAFELVLGAHWPVVASESPMGRDLARIYEALTPFGLMLPSCRVTEPGRPP